MDLKISTSQLSAIRSRTTSFVSDTRRPRSGTLKLPATTLRITGCPIQVVYPPSICPPRFQKRARTTAVCGMGSGWPMVQGAKLGRRKVPTDFGGQIEPDLSATISYFLLSLSVRIWAVHLPLNGN